MRFTKKDMEIINRVLELEELEPENNHLYLYILSPLYELVHNTFRAREELETMESIFNELKHSGCDKCRKRIYNRRLRALMNMLDNKISKIDNIDIIRRYY